MTEAPTSPTLTDGITKYPVCVQAKAYLRKFLRRWGGWYLKNRQYGKCRYSASLDIIVIRLANNIFEVRAYPPDNLRIDSLEEALKIEEFRGWIFANEPRFRKSKLIVSTQKMGVEPYKLARLAIRHKGKLARAEIYYRKLLANR